MSDRLISLNAAIDAVNSIDNLDAKARGGICIKLMGLPSAQPSFSQHHENDHSHEDAVSRKAVEEMLKNGFPARGMWEIEGDVVKQTVCETLADALMDLEKLPSVTPKERWNPCDWCAYNPPSSMDGKPCTMCPAAPGRR